MNKVHYKLALPEDVKDWIAMEAAKNLRSQSATIIYIIRKAMEAETATAKK